MLNHMPKDYTPEKLLNDVSGELPQLQGKFKAEGKKAFSEAERRRMSQLLKSPEMIAVVSFLANLVSVEPQGNRKDLFYAQQLQTQKRSFGEYFAEVSGYLRRIPILTISQDGTIEPFVTDSTFRGNISQADTLRREREALDSNHTIIELCVITDPKDKKPTLYLNVSQKQQGNDVTTVDMRFNSEVIIRNKQNMVQSGLAGEELIEVPINTEHVYAAVGAWVDAAQINECSIGPEKAKVVYANIQTAKKARRPGWFG